MHYNELFEDVLKQKYRDMAYIKEKNARLRYILSEINYFSKTRIDLEIPDPEWIQREQPEEIIRVMDYEMKVTPYISPSQQAILDAKAAEEERIRLALLADDFKDRALMKMMNGVLEVRWEDELKKDVPIPKCMLEKEPEHFNEEDLIAIRDYEENVAFLNSERERYKNLLDGEFTKISLHLRDMIRKFNLKVKHSLECKMDIDSAANEENLKVNRVRWNQKLRIDLIKKQESVECSFRETDAVIAELRRTISSLSESLQECRLEVDLHQVREKLLEKTFRKDIQDLSSLVQEQAIKIYKKKPPKVVFRHAITGAIYMELARCVANNEKSLIITEGGLNFVKALDAFDNFTGVPPTIDENTHNLICKHRRLRIEYELKLKGYQTQVTDGENAIAIYQKRLNTNREKYVRLQAEYHEVNRDYLYLTHNMQIQLVLRRGLVEVPLSGSAYDFKDAMLVPKKEIEHINQLIKEAGNKKIQAIMKNMTFRRCIMIREWNHRKLRMQINDLLEHIKDIDSVKFTREMQQYLKAKKAGRRIEDSVESELDTISQTFQHRIKDKMDKYDKLKKDIQTYKDHNTALDESIQSINVDLCDLHLQKDETLSKKESEVFRLRMDALLKRSSVVNQIQHNHKEILILQTELELLRLRTYPTFKYKVIDS